MRARASPAKEDVHEPYASYAAEAKVALAPRGPSPLVRPGLVAAPREVRTVPVLLPLPAAAR